ncbi:WAT1-related protein At1g70260-like [Capsicum annuum]|uniref:WAT1-related protein At1g70260-like n=1 Tax=Capsicum annuum TaxID=4072 RepID=UPI001FB05B00|nr:WAT1-related protein At1g70260-like [Capsicum annuum]
MGMAMKIKEALPYIGMASTQFAQVGLMIVGKKAMSAGMTNFTFVFYSNTLAYFILIPSFLFYRSTRPPINFKLISGFFLLGVLGYVSYSHLSIVSSVKYYSFFVLIVHC